MKYGINCTKDVANNALIIQGVWSIDNIQFIADESQKKLICSPFTKTTNIAVVAESTTTTINIMPAAGCTLANDDLITFLIDDFKSTQDILDEIDTNLGAKGVSDLTIRELLAAIKNDALTTNQLNSVKDAIIDLIGAASDSSAANTIFGKIAAAKAIIDKIDASLGTDDNNDIHTKLNEILRIIDLFAYGYAITQNSDGTETYTLDLDNSASIDDSILNIA